MSEENVEIARRLTQALEAGFERFEPRRRNLDVGDVVEEFDSAPIAHDVELIPAQELADGQSYRGIAGVAEFMRTWTEDFTDWSIEYELFIAAPDDRVVALAKQSGIGRGSGVRVELRFGMVFEFADRQLIRVRLYLEPGQALEAAGLSE